MGKKTIKIYKNASFFLYAVILFISMLLGGPFLNQPHVAAASDYKYTSDTYTAIQGPNPFRVADQSENVTFRKVADPSQWYGFGNGVYLDLGSPRNDNAGGTCYPAIQTSNKKYTGDKNGRLYLECGRKGFSEQQSPRPVSVDKPGTVGAVNIDQRQVFDYELCPALKNIDRDLFNQTCNLDYAKQSDQDAAVKKMCDKYGNNQLKEQCDDYNNKTYNPDNAEGNAAGDDETQSCTGEGLSLGWILCPVVEAVSNFGNYVFSSYIRPMMEQNPLSLKPNDPFYKSWQGFRFLGNVLLIGSLLAVVYSQTRGGGN